MKKQLLLIAFATYSLTSQSQNPYWRAGGNTTAGLDFVNTTNNFIGTQVGALNNIPLKIGVNGSQDIFIDNNPAQLLPASINNPGFLQGGHWVGLGRIFAPSAGVGSNPLESPKAHLHIHGGGFSAGSGTGGFTAGIRNWMQTGTLYTENSNGMYVGLKSMFNGATINNESYAVINWSDDATGGNASTDFLSFNFTSYPGNGLASTNDGKELARMSPVQGRGTFGVGNFQILAPNTIYSDPVRRVEILDADPTTGVNTNAPQLRLTHQYNGNAALGVFSEFQTTAIGDLYFNTRTNGTARRFGFHTNTPNNTVEITSQPGILGFGSVNGSSGLRLTNMKSSNTPQANPGAGVLSVDGNGDVIYVPAGVSTANNGVINNGGVFQLGGACNNLGQVFAATLSADRVVPIANFNFWFGNLNNSTGGVGVGGQPASTPFCNVGNTFEISANLKSTKYGNTNASGLRLTKLTSANIPQANGGVNLITNTKLLSVDKDGDVVLVNAPVSMANADNGLSTNGPTAGAIHLGQNVGAVGNPGQLLNSRQVPMNNFNISFTDGISATANQNRIEVGPFNPAAASVFNPKLTSVNISSNANRIGGWFSTVYNIPNVPLQLNPLYFGNIGGTRSIGIVAYGVDTIHPGGRSVGSTNFAYQIGNGGGQGSAFGVSAKAIGTNNGFSIFGVLGIAYGNAASVYGGSFSANAVGSTNANAFGLKTDAINGLYNYATYASAPTPNGTNTSNNNHYAGFFNGGVYSAQIIFPSDELIKKDKNIITDAITKLSQLDPISYQFDTTIANPKGLSLPGGLQYGFKAQQVETVYPELVSMIHKPADLDTAGNVLKPAYDFKGVNYIGFIALLTKAVQQQKTKIDSLTTKTNKQDSINNSLQAQINSIISTFSACCTNTTGVRATGITGNNQNQLTISLSDADVIVLNQNVPNPFAEQTTITYNVPAKYGFAQMIFKTLDGKIIRTVDITTKGKGQLNVFANDLSNGLYMYSLIVDGKVIDTKKMVKE